jgi:hypothetical protein
LAQLPFREIKSDGIIINSKLFGSHPENEFYKQGYTLVNLMGKYLGLKPLHGYQPCEGDGVNDTPDINAETIFCYPQDSSFYVSDGCYFQDRRMTHNFMDNIPDECAAMFSFGQKVRMHAFLGLKGPRHTLINENYDDCNRFNLISSTKESGDNDVLLYPNPTNNYINIEWKNNNNGEINSYIIYNLLGDKILTGEFNEKVSLDLSFFSQGIYFLFVKTNTGSQAKKIFSVIRN